MSIYIYDFTLKYEINSISQISDLQKLLNTLAKKWGFQIEVGEQNGYQHIQGRLSLIKKTPIKKLITLCKNTVLEGAHFSPTSNNSVDKGIYYYCDKIDTRLEGTKPYKDTDPPAPTMTRQLQEFIKFKPYPWQEDILHIATEYDPRSIYFIVDKNGNNGKSMFCEYLEYKEIIDEVPFCNNLDDLRQFVCSRRKQGIERKCYVIDMPRGLKKEKISNFLCGVEEIKNGNVVDKRYNAEKIRFDRPQIIVFTNSLPTEMDCLSSDRWKIKYLDPNSKSLIDADSEGYPTQSFTTTHNVFDLDSDEC